MNQVEITDEEIVKIILNKDKNLYREIIKRYQIKLSHYLRKFISNQDDIEDILQVVFIKAYKNLYGFDTKKRFSSWIYRITHNEAINHLKKNKGNKVCLDDIEYKLIDEKININEYIDRGLLKNDVEIVIGKMEQKYKDPLILFYFEEKSYEEIGDILRIPINTVGTLILRGKKLIKDKLEEVNKKHG